VRKIAEDKKTTLELVNRIQDLQSENDKLSAENKRLKNKLKTTTEKFETLSYESKLRMSEIVRLRRLIEHYEDGAPNYVANQW